MSVQEDVDRAQVVDALHAVWSGRGGDPGIALHLRNYGPDSVVDGQELQFAVLSRLEAEGERLGGWKIGWTSRGARDRSGGARPVGYVLSSRILESGATLRRSAVPALRVEPELVLTLGDSLSGREVTAAEARAAVVDVRPGFELLWPRLPEGVNESIRLGNGLNNWGIVIGPPIDPATDLRGLAVDLRVDGASRLTGAMAPDNIDDPFEALSVACHDLAAFGRGFEAGQRLLAGSITPSIPATEGDRFEAVFGDLGSVSLTFLSE